MNPSKETLHRLNGKLRRPVHISYISNYILKLSVDETRSFLDKLINLGIIEESKYAKDYFVLKQNS